MDRARRLTLAVPVHALCREGGSAGYRLAEQHTAGDGSGGESDPSL